MRIQAAPTVSDIQIPNPNPQLPLLKTNGPNIEDRFGNVVTLRGTNLGGWLLHECWMTPAGDAMLPGHATWTAKAFESHIHENPENVFDLDTGNRWSSGIPQHWGQWFEVDLGEIRTFNQIEMSCGRNIGDNPARAAVRLSNNGHDWWDVGELQGDDPQQTLRIPHQSARFVSIVVTDPNLNSWWSIAELRLTVSDEYHTRSRLVERFGETLAKSLLSVYHDAWITTSDLDFLSDIGFNVLRLPLDWQLLMTSDGKLRPETEAFSRIDWLLDEAERRGLYVIIDLHGVPGGANPWHSSGRAGMNAFWREQQYQEWTETLWRIIAKRYHSRTVVAGYDLINEPLVSMGDAETRDEVDLKFAIYDRLYRAIREVDPNHIIFIAAFPSWEQARPPWDFGWHDVVYQSHHYNFQSQEHHGGMQTFIDHELGRLSDYRSRWGVPVYAGEFWFGPFPDLYDRWLTGLNALGASWTSWTYKVKNSPTSRGPDGILNGVGWSLFYDNPNPSPDLDRDNPDEIARTWSRFATSKFRANPVMQAIYKRHAKAMETL